MARRGCARTLVRMEHGSLTRRSVVAGTFGLALVGLTACAGTAGASTSASTAVPSGAPSMGSMPGGGGPAVSADASLKRLEAEVKSKFKQATYTDSKTGKTLPYNVYLPAGYHSSKSYPLVLYIADSSLVGQAVTAPLSQYGALIWASSSEQAKHASIVVVPEYPSVIIDDHGSHTMTGYVEMTARFVSYLQGRYSVDRKRVYGTGQSMGCMTLLYLAAQHPDLFAAELFVSGQWQISQLAGLSKQKFFYIAAGGDGNSTAGQQAVKKMLTRDGIKYQTATWDVTWSTAKTAAAAKALFSAGNSINFATFRTGTVLKASGASATAMGGSGEHMASFEPAYKITALRDWLFSQHA